MAPLAGTNSMHICAKRSMKATRAGFMFIPKFTTLWVWVAGPWGGGSGGLTVCGSQGSTLRAVARLWRAKNMNASEF